MPDSYTTIKSKLAALEPFTGNSMSARGDVDDMGYSVYSYRTEIMRVMRDPDTGEFVAFYAEENHWGPTTGKHMGMRAWLPGRDYPLHTPRQGGHLRVPERFRKAALQH